MPVSKSPQEQQREAELMQNVLLLLNHLIENERTTVKLILDCLYEVGSLNLINQQVAKRPLNRSARAIATASKSVFRIIAWQWFRQNCPTLITDWLHEQVSFAPVQPEAPPSLEATTATASPFAESSPPELQRLQIKVRVLTSLCLASMGFMVVFGGIAVWQMYSSHGLEPLNQLPPAPQSTNLSPNDPK